MKIMNVSLTIDLGNPAQTQALKQLMDALGPENASKAVKEETVSHGTQAKSEEVSAEELEKAKRKARRDARLAKEAEEARLAKEAEEAEEDEEDEDFLGEEDEEDEEDGEEEITVAMLRELTSQHSKTHRDAIKKKLAEYGSANVTSIPEDNYRDYYKFLKNLK